MEVDKFTMMRKCELHDLIKMKHIEGMEGPLQMNLYLYILSTKPCPEISFYIHILRNKYYLQMSTSFTFIMSMSIYYSVNINI